MALTIIAPVIDQNGITAPTYDQILAWLKQQYRSIYGNDVYLDNDSMDGQFLGVLALQFAQVNAACIKTYNSFSPNTASGDALTRNVKINGIKRALATYSTVDVLIKGQAGTAINNGAVGGGGNRWILPASLTIPPAGEITVTATSEKAGAIFAAANTLTEILTPTRGWWSVNNFNTSSLGQDVESDAKLRQRQALSVSIASMSQTEGLRAAILALPNVTRCKTYENKTSATDVNGLPRNSICVIAAGGDSQAIARLIHSKKSMGCALHGNTTVNVTNVYGATEAIKFYRPNIKNIGFKLAITASASYSADTANSIAQNLASYVNGLDIGDKIMQNKLFGAANLFGAEQSRTFDVTSIVIVVDGADQVGDYILPFGFVAFCDAQGVSIEVTSG